MLKFEKQKVGLAFVEYGPEFGAYKQVNKHPVNVGSYNICHDWY